LDAIFKLPITILQTIRTFSNQYPTLQTRQLTYCGTSCPLSTRRHQRAAGFG